MIFVTILAFVQGNVRDNQRCNQKWTIKKDRKMCTRQNKDIQNEKHNTENQKDEQDNPTQ